MKVGILTFHRAINYGAVLQAYALQETLRTMGHDAWIINYCGSRTEWHDRHPYNKFDKWNLLSHLHLRSFVQYDTQKKKTLARHNMWDKFLEQRLCLTEPCLQNSIPQDFDAYIVGSDQVWNSAICEGLDPVFWGDLERPDNSKLIAYAASTSVRDLQNNNQLEIKRLLQGFSSVSVREQDVADYIDKTYSVPASVVLDPTLLADRQIWDAFDTGKYKDKKYVLYFTARQYAPNPLAVKQQACQLADQMNCDAITINFNEDTPEDFVMKFKYASAVVTSSFHGVAFSLIFNRPLYAICYGDEQDSRYVNVLNTIGTGMFLHQVETCLTPYDSVDYSGINIAMNNIKDFSKQYLLQSLIG